MSTAPQTTPGLLTAEEFARRPDPGYPEELVKGRVVAMPPPGFRHGTVCARVVFLLRTYLTDHDTARVTANGVGVITVRDPDTVRRPDVSIYGMARVPNDPRRIGYIDVPPDFVFEVISPDDHFSKVVGKVGEYLDVGVSAVGVLDPGRRTLLMFAEDDPPRVLAADDELTLPALLGDFRVAVGRFFE